MKALYPRVLLLAAILPLLAVTHVSANDSMATKAVMVGKPIVKRVRLQYITPSDCLQSLLGGGGSVVTASLPEGTVSSLPSGIVHIDTNDITNTIVFSGTPDAIDQVMTIIGYLDVNRKLVELQVTFMRYRNATDLSDTRATAIAFGKAIVPSNIPTDMCVVGDGHVLRVHLTAHMNGDDSCSLFSQISSQAILPSENGASVLGAVKQDTKVFVRGKVNSDVAPTGDEAPPEIESFQTSRQPNDGMYFAVITPYRVQTY